MSLIDYMKLTLKKSLKRSDTQNNIVKQLKAVEKRLQVQKFTDDLISEAKMTLSEWNRFYCLNYYECLYERIKSSKIENKYREKFDSSIIKEIPLFDEESYLFGVFAENKVSMLFFQEIFKVWSIINDPIESSGMKTTQTEMIVQFFNEFKVWYASDEYFEKVHDKWLDLMGNISVLWQKKKPSIMDRFEWSHIYQYVETMFTLLYPLRYPTNNKSTIFGFELPKVIETSWDVFNIEELFRKSSKDMEHTPTIQDELETVLVTMVAIVGTKETYINSQVSIQNPGNFANKPRIRATMDENAKRAMKVYQPELFDQLEKNMIILQDCYIEYFKRDAKFDHTMYLLRFHYFLHEKYHFSHWFYRYVVKFEALCRYPAEVKNYSKIMPLWLQIQPYVYHLVWKGELQCCNDVSTLFHRYLSIIVTECKGILKLEKDITKKTPWILITKRDIPHLINLTEMFKTEVNIKDIMTQLKDLNDVYMNRVEESNVIEMDFIQSEEAKSIEDMME
jgi:hypothetical protein